MRPSTVARRYAQAAFDVARDQRQTDAWLRDLERAAETLSDPRAALYFRDPKVTSDDKLAVLPEFFPGIRAEVMNLLRMLAQRERLSLVPSIYREFQSLDRQDKGIVEAEVTVARPFTEAERGEIARRLADATGKRVEMHVIVDASILGGIVVQIGDRLTDASVAGRLERLRHDLAV